MWRLIYWLKMASVPFIFPIILYYYCCNIIRSNQYVLASKDPGINIRYINFFKLIFWLGYASGYSIKLVNKSGFFNAPALYIYQKPSHLFEIFLLDEIYKNSKNGLPTLVVPQKSLKKSFTTILDLIDFLEQEPNNIDALINQTHLSIKQHQTILVGFTNTKQAIQLLKIAYKNTIPVVPVHFLNTKKEGIVKKSNSLIINIGDPIRPHKYLNLVSNKLFVQVQDELQLLSKKSNDFYNKENKKSNKVHKDTLNDMKQKIKSIVKK